MGIKVEFNPDLALRNISEFQNGNRKEEECIPNNIEVGKIYPFLKAGQRNYWLEVENPLVETKGKYKIMEVFNDDKIHFDGYTKI